MRRSRFPLDIKKVLHLIEEIEGEYANLEVETRAYLLKTIRLRIGLCETYIKFQRKLPEVFEGLRQSGPSISDIEVVLADLSDCRDWLSNRVTEEMLSDLDIMVKLMHCAEMLAPITYIMKSGLSGAERRRAASRGGSAIRLPTETWNSKAETVMSEISARHPKPNKDKTLDEVIETWKARFGERCPVRRGSLSKFYAEKKFGVPRKKIAHFVQGS